MQIQMGSKAGVFCSFMNAGGHVTLLLYLSLCVHVHGRSFSNSYHRWLLICPTNDPCILLYKSVKPQILLAIIFGSKIIVILVEKVRITNNLSFKIYCKKGIVNLEFLLFTQKKKSLYFILRFIILESSLYQKKKILVV